MRVIFLGTNGWYEPLPIVKTKNGGTFGAQIRAIVKKQLSYQKMQTF